MTKFFYHIYKALLWFLGFKNGEYITFMLKRQELRLGVLWWLLVATTQAAITVIMRNYLSEVWFTALIFPVNIITVILVWHVVRTPSK